MRMVAILLATAATVGCASSQPRPAPNSRARVTLTSLKPTLGAIVNSSVVIAADITFEIYDFQPGAKYVLSPQFDTADGHHSFHPNWPKGIADLTSGSGTISVTYKLADVWNEPQLARRPIKVHFTIMKMTSATTGDPLGQTETITYMTESM